MHHQESGLTIVEVLVTLVVFSILALAMLATYKTTNHLNLQAVRIEHALLLAQDLYEEMRAQPFEGASREDADARPLRTGSFLAYNGLSDSPVQDILGREVPWGTGLCRRVEIRRFTPQDRARALPPQSPPTMEYAECVIKVSGVGEGEPIVEGRFVRGMK